jgi:hypothetical protein
VATNDDGVDYGFDQTFTTLATTSEQPPSASTGDAVQVTTTSATLTGTVNPNGSNTLYYFEYGTTSDYGSYSMQRDAGIGTSDVSVETTITGLSPDTTYQYRLVALNLGGTEYGSEQSFTTLEEPATPPSATTGPATSVTTTSATLSGTVNPNGKSTTYYFEYGDSTDYGSVTESTSAGSGTGDVSVGVDLTGLSPDTTYHYRLTAVNDDGTDYGADMSLTTGGSSGGEVPENGYLVTSELWIRAVIDTEDVGEIEAVWQQGGEDITSAGDQVIWGYFYASPNDVTWGSSENPDLFVKIWFDHSGRLDVNFFHVSVPHIEVYSDYPYDGDFDEFGATSTSLRYVRHYYENGEVHSDWSYEDGAPPAGYSPSGNPWGDITINDLRLGVIINTVETGPVEAVLELGGYGATARGDIVLWGHFYANPSDVDWGSKDNPDLFIKVWFDASGRLDVNFFHVSVPDIEVYSDFPIDGIYDYVGTTIMSNRYIRHEYFQ